MKFIITFLLIVLYYNESQSQKLDQSIVDIANNIVQKVLKKNKVRLAVTDFVNSEGKVDGLTDYIREELELRLINAENLQLIDRKHIKLLLSENKLQSDGLIDESTAKSSASFIKVDGWVIAEISSLGDQIKIKVKVIDVTTSQIFAASTSDLISDIAINNLLNPPICPECEGKGVVQLQTICTVCNGKGNYLCKDCNGSGRRDGMTVGSYIKCESCNGDGLISCNACSAKGKIVSYKTCPRCKGRIQLNSGNASIKQNKIEICSECNGSGKIKVQTICDHCNGSGEAPFGPASNWEKRPCKYCSGKGQITFYKSCPKCDGSGNINLK